jgi:nucleoside diphosphate kinase
MRYRNKDVILCKEVTLLLDIALVLIKPDSFVRDLDALIIQQLEEQELEIVAKKIVQMDEQMIRAYQPILNEPSEFGEEWKTEAIVALTSRPVAVLIVRGEDAMQKTLLLKKQIRSKYCPGSDYQSRIIFNLLHTADSPSELENNINVLFPEANRLI